MIVPGSIPKIMMGFFRNTRIIFSTSIIEVTLYIEQKYQNIHQMVPGALTRGMVILLIVQAG